MPSKRGWTVKKKFLEDTVKLVTMADLSGAVPMYYQERIWSYINTKWWLQLKFCSGSGVYKGELEGQLTPACLSIAS